MNYNNEGVFFTLFIRPIYKSVGKSRFHYAHLTRIYTQNAIFRIDVIDDNNLQDDCKNSY